MFLRNMLHGSNSFSRGRVAWGAAMVRKVAIAIAALLSFACARERLDLQGITPSPLLEHVRSLSSPYEVRQQLGSAVPWTDEEGTQSPQNDSARFAEYVALIPHCEVYGYKGALRLDFVNNKLLSIWFYADDADGFVRELVHRGIAFRRESDGVQRYTVPSTHTAIRVTRDKEGRPYVAWEDEHFREAVDD